MQLRSMLSNRIQKRPAPWDTPEGALAFIDPELPEALGIDLVRDLLRVATGENTARRRLSENQVALLRKHRVMSLVPEGWGAPEPPQSEKRKLTMWSLALETESRRTISLLKESGISPIVLKGMATRYLDYPSPALRHSGDLDLLVKESELGQAAALLVQRNFEPVIPDRLDQEFLKGRAFRSRTGVEVDLHTRINAEIVSSGFGLRAVGSVIPELNASVLSIEHRLVHAAAHCFLTPPEFRRLSGLADISAILSSGNVDRVELKQRSVELGLEQAVGAALRIEAAIVGRASHGVESWQSPTGWARLAFARSTRLRWAEKVFALSELPQLTDRLRFLKQMALPGQEFTASRGGLRRYLSGSGKR